MREVLIRSVRILSALFLAAFLLVAPLEAEIYWLAASGLPDHHLVDGASSWHGCIPPNAKRGEFVPLSACPRMPSTLSSLPKSRTSLCARPINP